MRPFASVISLDDARRALQGAVVPIARTERVPLDEAMGRVAARDVASEIDVPPFARSAMDGYAVRSSDTASAVRSAPARLRIVERVYTGQMPAVTIVPGTCVEIATGAPIPAGADAVVMVEETAPAGASDVAIFTTAATGQNVSPRGADISRGTPVVRHGDVLSASRVGALAAIGCADVEVFVRPRVAIVSTGNEVVHPGEPLALGQIYDVNRFTLAAIVAAHGGAPDPHAAVPDTVDALGAALDRLKAADIIVFSGGSSVGERDLILDLVSARGEMIFHGVAIKPGKPTAFARIGGKPFFGMPGNPTSCLSNAYVLLVPFVRATARLPPYSPRTTRIRLGQRIVSASGRHTFYTVRIEDGTAFPAFRGSGAITSLSQADGYIEIPADEEVVEEGTVVDVTLF
jgi:molybdopterin molybdotransferase